MNLSAQAENEYNRMIHWDHLYRFLFTIFAFFVSACALQPAFAQPVIITISETGGVPISPYLYGINYDWNKVSQGEFKSFTSAMSQTAHHTLMRYPGGWNAENYNWEKNTESGKKVPAEPGVSPSVFLASVQAASFITPSERAIAHPEKIRNVVKQTCELVAKYEGVHYWEIGNEWWLQAGAKQSSEKRMQNLQNYAALLKAVVPAMKIENPAIKIFAMGDWTAPNDIATLRQLTGPAAWSQIDGISIHSYCGITDPNHLCSSLPTKLAVVRTASGKQLLYSSEWAVAKILSTDDFGIRNASYTISAIQDLAFSGVSFAAYWPPVKVLPSIALVSADYQTPFATGIAFGWMAEYYEGTALRTSGPLPAVAARNGTSTTVIIPSGNSGSQTVWIALTGTGLSKVISADVMFSSEPDDQKLSRLVTIASLPTSVNTSADGSVYVQFTVNPGTEGRGSAFEIARVTMG